MKSSPIAAFAVFSILALPLAQSPAQSPAPTPVAATAPANSAAATIDSPEIRELQKVEDNWSIALNQRDQYGLELVLSPLFVGVSATGDITTRNQQVVSLINQEDKTASTDMHVITVRMLGDVAVVNGTYSFTHKINGNVVDEKGVFTHVFQRVRGNWLCLNAQRTMLREEGPSSGKSKSKSKSQADLPFHIPLFSKSDKSSQNNQ